jgi:hypothetical protein
MIELSNPKTYFSNIYTDLINMEEKLNVLLSDYPMDFLEEVNNIKKKELKVGIDILLIELDELG